MSNVFTLDALREETINKYAPTKIELPDGSSVELKSILRLKKKAREEVLAAVEDINSNEEDEEDEDSLDEWSELVVESVSKVFRLIASSPRKLIAELEHDDPQVKASLYTAVLTKWIGNSQLGEAEPSLPSRRR